MNNQQILEDMARAGFEYQFDEQWDDLPLKSIDRDLWVRTAKAMLKSVKFPAELYRVCRDLVYKAD